MLSRFHLIPGRYGRTDRQTDERTDLLYQYRASECWRAIKTRNEVGTKAPAHFSSLCREFTANNIVHWLHVQCSAVFSRTSSHTQLGVHHVGLRRHRRATTVWNVDGMMESATSFCYVTPHYILTSSYVETHHKAVSVLRVLPKTTEKLHKPVPVLLLTGCL